MQDPLFLLHRRVFLRAGAVISFGLVAGCSTSNIQTSGKGTGSDQTAATLGYVNGLRQGKGLSTLVSDPAASVAALHQAARMAETGKMQHNIGWRDNFHDRMKGQGVTFPVAENIAMGQEAAEDAYRAWVNSSGHLKNMLGDYRGLGVAMARNSASGNRPYWAMVLSG
ncbi:MAG TPA: CAP domain-containing protein [Sinorhizobium sp.]|nr:CAP domain-containing protein [Sinorhizobium sp.]